MLPTFLNIDICPIIANYVFFSVAQAQTVVIYLEMPTFN